MLLVGGSFRKSSHFVAPSCKLELVRFSALPRIQDGAECGNNWNLTLLSVCFSLGGVVCRLVFSALHLNINQSSD